MHVSFIKSKGGGVGCFIKSKSGGVGRCGEYPKVPWENVPWPKWIVKGKINQTVFLVIAFAVHISRTFKGNLSVLLSPEVIVSAVFYFQTLSPFLFSFPSLFLSIKSRFSQGSVYSLSETRALLQNTFKLFRLQCSNSEVTISGRDVPHLCESLVLKSYCVHRFQCGLPWMPLLICFMKYCLCWQTCPLSKLS